MKCIRLLSISAWKFAKNIFCQRKDQIPPDRRASMRKRSKLQKKIQMSTNHQTKENVLNQIREIEKDLKISIHTERNLREKRILLLSKITPILLQIRKKRLKDQS